MTKYDFFKRIFSGKKTNRSGERQEPKPRRLIAESLEDRSLLSVTAADFTAIHDPDLELKLSDVVGSASAAPLETLSWTPDGSVGCPGCAEHAFEFGDVEEYPAFKDTIDGLLTSAGQNLDSLSEDFIFSLSSCPESTYTIYLDFNGSSYTGSYWNSGNTVVTPPYDVDSDTTTFSNAELRNMYEIWYRVSEDYMPFHVNVTTLEPTLEQLMKDGSDDVSYGIRVAIGGDNSWYSSGAGGVAYVGSFHWTSDTPCYIFAKNVAAPKSTAAAITHEVGHSLGLSHDGTSEVEYYNGANGWAPHMGSGYYGDITQWSKGEYEDANNQEDDLEIIATQNGFSYRADDHGDDLASATALSFTASGVLGAGIIERNTDVDFFSFNLAGEQTVLTVGGVDTVTNLDAYVNLYNASGELIATYDPVDSFFVSIDVSEFAPGKYYLGVAGTGRSVDGVLHYTDYGSLGAYTIATDNVKPLDVWEPNDSSSTASNLGFLNSETTFDGMYIGASDGGDWYKFTIGAAGDANSAVEINYELNVGVHCMYLGLYDSNLNYVNSSFWSNTANQRISLADKPAGTYYLRTYSYYSVEQPFPYTLTVNAPYAEIPDVPTVASIDLSTNSPEVGSAVTAAVLQSDAEAAYQWYRGTRDGFAKSPIVGANGSSYTPTADDVGYYLRVAASGINGSEGSVSATATAPVVAQLVSVTFSTETPAYNANVYAVLDPANATATYQWYRGLTPDSMQVIDGATDAMYRPVWDDVGYYLSVLVNGVGYYYGSVSATSAQPVVEVADPYEPNNSRAEAYDLGVISGAKTVTAEADADRAYDWFKFTTIGEGTADHSIVLTHETGGSIDVDIALYDVNERWVASSTRSSSPETIQFAGIAPGTYYLRIYNYRSNSETVPYTLSFALPQKSITLSTSQPRFGKIVTTTLKPADGAATWQWYRVDDSGAATAISGKTNSYYTPVAADVGYRLRVVANSKGTTVQATSASVVTRDLTSVTMNNAGTNPTVGTRIVTYVAPSTGTATYQWFRIDSTGTETAIPDATGYAYTPVEADAGCYLKVVATGTGAYTGVVSKRTSNPLPGAFTVTLSPANPAYNARVSATISPADSSATYQWYRVDASGASTAISNATKSYYVATASDVGYYLRVVATSKGMSVQQTTQSVVTRALTSITMNAAGTNPAKGKKIITYIAPSAATVDYQWYRVDSTGKSTKISGATESTYTPTANDSACYLKVVATGTGGYTGSVSVQTGNPMPSLFEATVTASPKFNGKVKVTLSPSGATATYTWYRVSASGVETEISGVTANNYTARAADVGCYLKVVATGTGSYAGQTASATTANKVTRPLVSVTLPASIKYNVSTSGFLSPSTATATYQWYRGDGETWTVISGATKAKYLPTATDVGKYLKVVATGSGSYTGTVERVSASKVTRPLVSVTLNAATEVGKTITAYPSPGAATVTYQWYRSKTASNWTAIDGATKKTY
ncbi:MAG: hypothetical protein II622_07355, partial [Thermoguttaceae bacterium]|nr:hypothetical protein [Thermoguttaceae bacterium]